MTVFITAWSSLRGPALQAFEPRRALPERKHLKLMVRSVRLGVATALHALEQRPGWQQIPPSRRGLFVGTQPVGAPQDLEPALAALRDQGRVDVAAFGQIGVPLVPPLWLVKGLSNNIPGYACAYADIQGPVANRCEGRVGGLAAIVEAWRAVAEGRVDLAVAGGADSLIGGPPWVEHPGEGAAFVVLERHGRGPVVLDGGVVGDPDATDGPWVDGLDTGAAAGALALVQCLQRGQVGRIEAGDARVGLRAWLTVG